MPAGVDPRVARARRAGERRRGERGARGGGAGAAPVRGGHTAAAHAAEHTQFCEHPPSQPSP